jgi:hypothetical protein
MTRYHLEISEDERLLLRMAVAASVTQLVPLLVRFPITPDDSKNAYITVLDLLRRLTEVPKLPEGVASAPTTAASGLPRTAAAVSAARQPAPVVTTSEKPVAERVPDGVPDKETGELTITPVSVEQEGKAMVVSYQIRTGQKTRTTKTRCWDPKLFSALLATIGQTTTFLTRESKGFLNIVGVKPGVKP